MKDTEVRIGDKIRLWTKDIIIKGHRYLLQEAFDNKLILMDRYIELQPYIGVVLSIDKDDVLLNTVDGGVWVNYHIRNIELLERGRK